MEFHITGSEGAGAQQCAPATRRFHIQWKRKRGTNKWHVYTFIADRPVRSLKAKIRALTRRKSQQDPRTVLIRLNQVMRGWANYFKHAACKRTLSRLSHFVWWRVIRWLRRLHRWRWKDVHRRFTTPSGRWKPITVDGIELFNLATVPVTRYRYRENTIPNPWTLPNHAMTAETVESPVNRPGFCAASFLAKDAAHAEEVPERAA